MSLQIVCPRNELDSGLKLDRILTKQGPIKPWIQFHVQDNIILKRVTKQTLRHRYSRTNPKTFTHLTEELLSNVWNFKVKNCYPTGQQNKNRKTLKNRFLQEIRLASKEREQRFAPRLKARLVTRQRPLDATTAILRPRSSRNSRNAVLASSAAAAAMMAGRNRPWWERRRSIRQPYRSIVFRSCRGGESSLPLAQTAPAWSSHGVEGGCCAPWDPGATIVQHAARRPRLSPGANALGTHEPLALRQSRTKKFLFVRLS